MESKGIVVLTTPDGDTEVVGPFPDNDHSMEWVDRVQPQLSDGFKFAVMTLTDPFDPADHA